MRKCVPSLTTFFYIYASYQYTVIMHTHRGIMFGRGRGETNSFLDTANPIKDDGPAATLHIIDGQLEERHTDRCGDGQPRDEVQDSRH